jgi:ParB family transcriptional regulator, chromosome partitioning protein
VSVTQPVVPKSALLQLKVSDLRPSTDNPRHLFDPGPLGTLKRSIHEHGVLVPLTVYKLPGQQLYGIVDGERRFRCCKLLHDEGVDVSIPANVVDPPDAMAHLIYMFNIHSFREQWELMPTAIGLKQVIEHLGDPSDAELRALTGLSEPQINRCRIILEFPEHFQKLSLDPDPKTRIPSNFWIELKPVLDLAGERVPAIYADLGRDGICAALVEKYRAKKIKSVVHFRRIVEAFEVAEENPDRLEDVQDAFRGFVLNVDAETRQTFDRFVVDQRKAQKANEACAAFIADINRSKVELSVDVDRNALIFELRRVIVTAQQLIERLSASDPPPVTDEEDDD